MLNSNKTTLVDLSNFSEEDIKRSLELLKRDQVRKERIKNGEIKGYKKYSEYTEEEKERSRLYNRKRNIKLQLLAKKAIEAGLEVSDEEIDEEMKKNN